MSAVRVETYLEGNSVGGWVFFRESFPWRTRTAAAARLQTDEKGDDKYPSAILDINHYRTNGKQLRESREFHLCCRYGCHVQLRLHWGDAQHFWDHTAMGVRYVFIEAVGQDVDCLGKETSTHLPFLPTFLSLYLGRPVLHSFR